MLLLAALAFAWFVWPTPYRYMRMQSRDYPFNRNGQGWFLPVCRINRLTGRIQVYELPYWSNPGSAQGKWIEGWQNLSR